MMLLPSLFGDRSQLSGVGHGGLAECGAVTAARGPLSGSDCCPNHDGLPNVGDTKCTIYKEEEI